MSIRLAEVYKSFGPKEVLNGFSLTVREGETLAIIGGSGTGKSVALKHIVGLLRPDSGDVWVDEEAVARLPSEQLYELRRRVGFVFQFAALFDSMSVADNVGLGLRRLPDMTEEVISQRVDQCLRLVDMDGYQDRLPAELSGGQRKRVGIARAIATEPKYLLYDEPTTGLDPVNTTVIDRLIVRMADELGVTGVVVTHDMTSAYRVSDRIAMLHEGRIRFEGAPDEVRSCDDPVVRSFVEGRPELLERST